VTRELIAADAASLTCRVDFAEKFSAALVSLSGVMADLVRGHLLNQFTSFLNTESEERTSSSIIYMLLVLSESTHDRSFG
jgi:hypothetical protein